MYKIITLLLFSFYSWNGFGHGDLERRIQAKTKAIAQEPQNATLYVDRGFLYHQHEEWDEALADYLQAQELGLQEKILFYRMAETYLELYLFKSGLICTQQYLAQDSLDVKIHKLRGKLFYKSRAYDEAIYSYEYVIQHSIDLTPENYVTLAEVYATKDPSQKELVLNVIDRGLAKLGTQVFVLQEQKLIYFKKFNLVKQSIAQYDLIIKNNTRKEGWHYKKANYLYHQKRFKDAKLHIEAAKKAFEALKPHQQKTKMMLQLLANIHTLLQKLENK